MKNYHEDSRLLKPVDIEKLEKAFELSWSKETCLPANQAQWSPGNKACGQYAVIVLVVNDLYGGKIAYDKEHDHYWNILPDGSQHDFSRMQSAEGTKHTRTAIKERKDISRILSLPQNPSRNGAACYFEQINAFDCRCDHQHFSWKSSKGSVPTGSIVSRRAHVIYTFQKQYTRCGAIFPGIFVPVLTLEGKCLRWRAKPAHLVGHLPLITGGDMAGEDDTLEATIGPRARYSDYAIGDVVLYRQADGSTRTGEIMWTEPASSEHPLIYWIGLECLYATDIVCAVSTNAHVEEQQEGA